MSPTAKRRLPHRHNKNGSYDSICAICYMTIASKGIESELARLEAMHVCSPARLYEMNQATADATR